MLDVIIALIPAAIASVILFASEGAPSDSRFGSVLRTERIYFPAKS
jgi:hypothetical protein